MENKKLEYISFPKTFLCDFHLHTSWTDGKNSTLQMYNKAAELGLEYILFSEHARKSSEDWFFEFANEVRGLPVSSCNALVGAEVKIENFEGEIDSTTKIISHCDLVIGSVHRFPGEETKDLKKNTIYSAKKAVEIEYKLLMALIENPDVDILGHAFGMCYRRFKQEPPKHLLVEIINKCKQKGKAFEINSKYHPEPLELLAICKRKDTLFTVGSDAHQVENVGHVVKVLKEALKSE